MPEQSNLFGSPATSLTLRYIGNRSVLVRAARGDAIARSTRVRQMREAALPDGPHRCTPALYNGRARSETRADDDLYIAAYVGYSGLRWI
jgi:hypothetical protein